MYEGEGLGRKKYRVDSDFRPDFIVQPTRACYDQILTKGELISQAVLGDSFIILFTFPQQLYQRR